MPAACRFRAPAPSGRVNRSTRWHVLWQCRVTMRTSAFATLGHRNDPSTAARLTAASDRTLAGLLLACRACYRKSVKTELTPKHEVVAALGAAADRMKIRRRRFRSRGGRRRRNGQADRPVHEPDENQTPAHIGRVSDDGRVPQRRRVLANRTGHLAQPMPKLRRPLPQQQKPIHEPVAFFLRHGLPDEYAAHRIAARRSPRTRPTHPSGSHGRHSNAGVRALQNALATAEPVFVASPPRRSKARPARSKSAERAHKPLFRNML